ncbi:hypothetical protein [Paenibacillus paeoniae]|uniref:Uncharacterized protein n=1 Tax=Paenibacillus paeoniae TaxID=2292705 RepID=A0A371P7X3_9BACL|nr:hypothetical protein [Paenibacillus paeoniae]REK71985.1 hypothetical protein DX130_20035 [Paenibacillus paeoniae]
MQLNRRTKIILKLIFNSFPVFPFTYKEAMELVREFRNSNYELDEKIDKAFESLKDTSILLEELQEAVTEKTEKVKFLRNEYDRFSKLSELKEEEVKVLLTQFELTLNKGRPKELWAGFWISTVSGLIIFVIGIIVGPYLTKLIFGD